MGRTAPDEFRKDAVDIALTSGPTRKAEARGRHRRLFL